MKISFTVQLRSLGKIFFKKSQLIARRKNSKLIFFVRCTVQAKNEQFSVQWQIGELNFPWHQRIMERVSFQFLLQWQKKNINRVEKGWEWACSDVMWDKSHGNSLHRTKNLHYLSKLQLFFFSRKLNVR